LLQCRRQQSGLVTDTSATREGVSCLALWHAGAGGRETREARDLLAPVYGWFTEGFDTLDLKEA
jgi:hypothetical protein